MIKTPIIVCDEQVPYARQAFSRLGHVRLLDAGEINTRNLKSADVLIVRSVTKVGPELVSGTKIRTVGSVTSGIDHIDASGLREKGVRSISAPGSNANSVAEYVTASLLILAERKGLELKGMKIGIVGVGHIGSRVDRKCRALGMKTIWNDPPLARLTGDPRYRPRREILQSDIITLHVPLTFHGRDATYHMAGEELFRSMKKPFLLINTARGGVMDEKAVLKYARKGLLTGLVLDVWPSEPDVDHELQSVADIATPHIAGYSLDGKTKAVDMVFKGLCRILNVRDEWSVMDLLPVAAAGTDMIAVLTGKPEDVIRRAVLAAYDPRTDDKKLRKIVDLSSRDRGAYFERLRKRYPVRREFGFFRIGSSKITPGTRNTMKKLGFRC